MLFEKGYQRMNALAYARRWALDRNPLFINFAGIGGDCTSFASQCVLAGSCVMNFTPDFGWYYITSELRAPAWSSVEFFYDFITQNRGEGPYGELADLQNAEIGDIIQLQKENDWYHTLVVVSNRGGDILVAAHTVDALDRPLSTYEYDGARLIKIKGVRYSTDSRCFLPLLNGTELRI